MIGCVQAQIWPKTYQRPLWKVCKSANFGYSTTVLWFRQPCSNMFKKIIKKIFSSLFIRWHNQSGIMIFTSPKNFLNFFGNIFSLMCGLALADSIMVCHIYIYWTGQHNSINHKTVSFLHFIWEICLRIFIRIINFDWFLLVWTFLKTNQAM